MINKERIIDKERTNRQMFLVLLSYTKPLEEVEKHLIEHVAYLDTYYEKQEIIFSGRKNPRTGGVILFDGNDRTQAEEFVKGDPFYIHEVAEFEIIEFTPTKYNPRFAAILE
jgi:uncharacterized protein YciI